MTAQPAPIATKDADRAEQLVKAADAVTLGKDITPTLDEALGAINALHFEASSTLSPAQLRPASAAVLADFRLTLDGIPPHESLAPKLAALHDAAMDEYPEFAELLRGPRATRLIAARAMAMALGQPGADAAATEWYTAAIAAQIAQRSDHPLHGAAQTISQTVPALRARLAAVAERHRLRAEAERERARLAAEQAKQAAAATERAAESKRRAARLREEDAAGHTRRCGLVDFYAQHARYTFTVAGVVMSGAEAVDALKEGAEIHGFYNAQTTGVLRPRTVGAV